MSITECSASELIEQIKQPEGGYIPPETLEVISFGEGVDALNPEENVSPNLISLAVDYMGSVMLGIPIEEVFEVSMLGAQCVREYDKAWHLMGGITGLDDRSIINAVKLSGFDVCILSGFMKYKPVDEINPDKSTIQNVRTMIERYLRFMTSDTYWDLMVSESRPTKNHTLLLLTAWCMSLHSSDVEWRSSIKYLGIYNPRLNEVYRISVDAIPEDLINEIDRDVLGYSE